MTAFSKVQEIVRNKPMYGHALVNAQNIMKLRAAKQEIDIMLQVIQKRYNVNLKRKEI